MRASQLAVLAAFLLPTVSAPLLAASQNKPASASCRQLVKRLPDVKPQACDRAGLRATGAMSARGFPILSKVIPAGKKSKDAAVPTRVMLIGGIHGDELSSSSIVFHWMEMMQTPDAQRFEWIVAPAVNPDGLLAPKPSRVNANGVDLNRNFPTPNWNKEALRYWASRTGSDPRRFPGRAPLSEPESRWVNDQMQRFKPDVIISVHAPYGVLDFDGSGQPPFRFGRLPLNKVGIYPGSLGNYGGVHKNVPVITIELPNALSVPPKAEIERIWADMLAWIDDNVAPAAPPSPLAAQTSENAAPAVRPVALD